MQIASWKKNIGVFLGSQAISLFGSSLVQFAMTWYITLTTKSGVYATISIVCSMLPVLLLSPFAGVWADRYSRKWLIVLSDGAIALSTLLLALVFMAGYKPLWLLFAVQAVRGFGGAIQTPSVNALVPELVPEEQLTRVNGINTSVQSLLTLISPALGGALLAAVGSIEAILFIDVVTAAIAIFVMLRFLSVPMAAREPGERARGQLAQIGEGLSYVRRHKYLMHLLGYTLSICFLAAPVAFLTPLLTVRAYGEEVWRLTGIEVAFSAGMLGGGLLITVWKGFKNRIHTMTVALVLMAAGTALMGVGVPFWLYLALMGMVGVTMPVFNTPAIVMLQERVDGAYMGRIFSIVSMINSSMMPLGMVLFGPLADRVPIQWLLIATGVITLAISLTLPFNRTLRAVGLARAGSES